MSITGAGAVSQRAATVAAVGYEYDPNGGFLFPTTPNIVDFLTFLGTSVQIPPTALPPSSPWPQYALTQAIALVLQPPYVPGITYTLAVYNCATHLLFTIAPDQPGQNYFTSKRGPGAGGFNLIAPSTGVVVASSDESTSTTLAQPKWAAGLTVGQLGFYKTPWGRDYLSYIQSYGPSIWGLS
jgi:hypothetical protein